MNHPPTQNNMVELSLTDSVAVITDIGEQQMSIKELADHVATGNSVERIKVKVDLSCQG